MTTPQPADPAGIARAHLEIAIREQIAPGELTASTSREQVIAAIRRAADTYARALDRIRDERIAELEALPAQAEDHAAEYAGLPGITAIRRVDLKPGDHLVLTTSAADISDKQFASLAERVRRWAGFDIPALLLPDGWTLDLIGPPEQQP